MFLIGEKSGLQEGRLSTRTLLLWSFAVLIGEVEMQAFEASTENRMVSLLSFHLNWSNFMIENMNIYNECIIIIA